MVPSGGGEVGLSTVLNEENRNGTVFESLYRELRTRDAPPSHASSVSSQSGTSRKVGFIGFDISLAVPFIIPSVILPSLPQSTKFRPAGREKSRSRAGKDYSDGGERFDIRVCN